MQLTDEQRTAMVGLLKIRFNKNMNRHPGYKWDDIEKRLQENPEKVRSLFEMEQTGGEPDVVDLYGVKDQYVFCDCSAESPDGRRNICYDRQAMDSRKVAKPSNNAEDMAVSMGIEIMEEADYFLLQKKGPFDIKTSSWLKTPDDIRKLGGALYGDRRFGRVFVYHNGAQSYYAVRGFRGLLRL